MFYKYTRKTNTEDKLEETCSPRLAFALFTLAGHALFYDAQNLTVHK